MPNVGWSELLVIMVLALVVFGPNRLPEIARQIGKAIREVRRVSGEFQDEIRTGLALDEEDFPFMKGPKTETSALQAPTPPKVDHPPADPPQ